jgi:hypothetical protein
MIKGHVNLDFISDQDLANIKFTHEIVEDYFKNPIWNRWGIPMPDYATDSMKLLQVFEDDCPSWVFKIKESFDSWLHYSTTGITMMLPGKINAPHSDSMFRLKKSMLDQQLNTESMIPVRVNIFLQDKKIGHFLDFENGDVLGNYVRGDYVVIYPNVVHSAANVGPDNRYTMQLTGFVNEDELINIHQV